MDPEGGTEPEGVADLEEGSGTSAHKSKQVGGRWWPSHRRGVEPLAVHQTLDLMEDTRKYFDWLDVWAEPAEGVVSDRKILRC